MPTSRQSKSKLAVISGGTGYVGSAIARRIADDGFKVALLYRSTPEKARTIINNLPGSGHRAYFCDLGEASQVAQTISAIEKNQGPIHAAVHAAGAMPKNKRLINSTAEDLREQFEADTLPAFNFLSQCASRLKKRGRGILIGITTAGVVSAVNTRARGAYSPVKFAIQGILVALKEELAPHGVAVYSVAPGVMPGGLNSATPQAFLDIVKASGPSKTLASALDVANTVSILCSDNSPRPTQLTFLVAPESETN